MASTGTINRFEQLRIAAFEYANKGWPVLPIFGIIGNRCACGKTDCTKPGKHPQTKNGLKDASTSKQFIIDNFVRDYCNIAIKTGNGLFVLDVDNLDALEKIEKLPPTLTCITGSGGKHLYFRTGLRIPNSVSKIAKDIDVRCDGGYAIVPPSIHLSGSPYYWVNQNEPIADCPEWLISLAIKQPPEKQPALPDAVVEGARNNFLTKIAGKLRRNGSNKEEILSVLTDINSTKCRPPLPLAEIEQIAESISKYKSFLSEDWRKILVMRGDQVLKTPANAALLLTRHKEWERCLEYNEFSDTVSWVIDPPEGEFCPKRNTRLKDEHAIYMQLWFGRNMGITFPAPVMYTAAVVAAKAKTVHPLRDWLNSLIWDLKPRIDTWLYDYFGAQKKEIISCMGKWWLISSIARIFEPGCQVDYVLVLEGHQGEGKTKACRILGGQYYLGSMRGVDENYIGMRIQGVWIIEIAEMETFRSATKDKVKAFITQTEDVYKVPYDRSFTRRPRQCVFIATTDEFVYLDDPENRRYWPVRVNKIDIDGLKKNRDQLFAEAVFRYKAGEKWFPEIEHKEVLVEEQEERIIGDAWEQDVIRFLMASGNGPVTTVDILIRLGFDKSKIEKRHQMRLGDLLRRLGWEPFRMSTVGRMRGYRPTPKWFSLGEKKYG